MTNAMSSCDTAPQHASGRSRTIERVTFVEAGSGGRCEVAERLLQVVIHGRDSCISLCGRCNLHNELLDKEGPRQAGISLCTILKQDLAARF